MYYGEGTRCNMNSAIEYAHRLNSQDKRIISYIRLMQGEYGDDLLQNISEIDAFWALSSDRRFSVSGYPFDGEADVLVVGDRFGAITGGICDMVSKVDSVVLTDCHAAAIRKRYGQRDNLNVIVEKFAEWKLPGKYPYVCVNLEYINKIEINDTYEADCLLEPSMKALREDGKIIIFAGGDKLQALQKILYAKGLVYQQSYDPLRNGALLMEVSARDNLSEIGLPAKSPLFENKWIREHDFPYMGGTVFDQDIALIEQVKHVQIDLLKQLKTVCQKHGLTLYPVYGTLLGIIRDAGMIPSDDDIDVAMPRDDYDKLLTLAGQFQDDYVLQSPYREDCFYGGYSKLRNSNTTAIHPQNWWKDCCEGISIDIFPIDIAYASPGKERNKQRKIRFLQRLLFAKSYGYFPCFRDMKLLEWKSYKYLGKLFSRDKLVDCLYEEMKKGDKKGDRCAIYCHYCGNSPESARYMKMADFKQTLEICYEDVPMQVPGGWDNLLKGFYGEEYWEGQGFMEQRRRHGFYDVTVPYTVYKERFGGLKNPGSIQMPIVLFGDGSVFKACMTYYKDKVNITHLVLLPEETMTGSVYGMEVESWEAFAAQNVDRDSYRAIICSGDARAAEKVMQEAGYDKYFIFWHNRDWMLYANQSQVWKEIRELG